MTKEERIDWAYGMANASNPNVTREMVEKAALEVDLMMKGKRIEDLERERAKFVGSEAILCMKLQEQTGLAEDFRIDIQRLESKLAEAMEVINYCKGILEHESRFNNVTWHKAIDDCQRFVSQSTTPEAAPNVELAELRAENEKLKKQIERTDVEGQRRFWEDRYNSLAVQNEKLKWQAEDLLLRLEHAEAETHQTHQEIRASYDKTIADSWRADLEKSQAECAALREVVEGVLVKGKDGKLHEPDCMGKLGYACKAWCKDTRAILTSAAGNEFLERLKKAEQDRDTLQSALTTLREEAVAMKKERDEFEKAFLRSEAHAKCVEYANDEIAEAVAEEREACAKIADEVHAGFVASAIRDRGQKQEHRKTAAQHFRECGPICDHVSICLDCARVYGLCDKHRDNPDASYSWIGGKK